MKSLALVASAITAAFIAHAGASPHEPAPMPLAAKATETGVLFRSLDLGAESYRFAVYVPRNYDPARQWPCVVFLNGMGECGRDGQKQLGVGLLPAVMLDADQWPCIIVFPQKPKTNTQWEDHEDVVLGALESARREWSIDPARIALTGLSQGGHGTWVIGSRHTDLFSRLAPVCGYGDAAAIAPGASSLPVWAFHGEKDDVVKPSQSRDIIDAIKAHKQDADAKLTIFPNDNHNSWDSAYRASKLGEWLIQPRK